WEALPPLPAPRSGHMTATLDGTLVALGGTDFPTSLFEGGAKTWYDDVFVLEPGASAWVRTDARLLPRPLGYAAVVSVGPEIVIAGGSDAGRHFADAFTIRRSGTRWERSALPPLPAPRAMAGTAVIGRTVFVIGGQEAPDSTDASADVFVL